MWPIAATSAGLPTPLSTLSVLFLILYVGLFGLGREPSTASCWGLFQGWTWGVEWMLQIVDVTSHFLEHILCTSLFFNPFLPKPYPAHDPGADDEIWDEGQEWLRIFLLISSPGYLAFFSIRRRGFVFLLVPVWKHFIPSCVEWLNCRMGKCSPEKLHQAMNKMKCVLPQQWPLIFLESEGKVMPIFPLFLPKTQSFRSLLNNIMKHVVRNFI